MGRLFIVSAPSGAGKTTIVENVLKLLPTSCQIKKVITYTTKKPRENERDGIDYYFLSQSEFQKKVEEGFFLEWSTAYKACYGSPRSIIKGLDQGLSYIIVLDRNGAKHVAQEIERAVLIWIDIESIGVLESRLKKRATEHEGDIAFRIALAKKEMELEKQDSIYKYRILNKNIDESVKKLERILIAEIGGR